MSTWAQASHRAAQRVPERSRCEPSAACCLRSDCDMADPDRRGVVIDASVCINALGYCPMFVRRRIPRGAVAGAVREPVLEVYGSELP
jgi:hypothetical protein